MKIKKFKVTDECIGCRACVGVAPDNFDINDENVAFLKKQPESDEEEVKCEEAIDVCPVGAIEAEDIATTKETVQPILANSIIKTTLDTYPQLKPILIGLSPKLRSN